MSRRLLAAVATAALTCGISACTEGQESARTDPPTEVVADAPSDGGGESPVNDGGGDAEGADAADGSTSAAADLPAPDPADFPGMDENTPEGAEQTVRFYFANAFWGYQTMDASRAAVLHSDSCEACQEFATQIGDPPTGVPWGVVELKDFGVTHVESDNFDHEIGYIFNVGRHEEPTGPSGDVEMVEPVDYTAVVGLNWVDGKWRIEAMSFGESGHA